MKTFTLLVAAMVLAAGVTGSAAPQTEEVRIAFSEGRVSLAASETLASDVLAIWAKTGGVELSGAEFLRDRRVTLKLYDVPEQDALKEIVGDAAGYIVSWKRIWAEGTSQFASITIGELKEVSPEPWPTKEDTPPEAIYSYYFAPENMGDNLGATSSPELREEWPVPETLYEYSVPAKAADGPKLVQGDVKVDNSLPPPEVRFTYSVPNKIQP